MALINPQLTKNLKIEGEVMQGGEGMIPHLHVFHDKTRTKCSYIRLDKAEYSTHHKDGYRLPRKLKEEFIQLMNSPWNGYIIRTNEGYRPATGYEAAVYIWADTYNDGNLDNFQFDDSGELIMPNYENL